MCPTVENLPDSWQVKRLGSFCIKIGTGATPCGGSEVYLKSRVSHALVRSQHVFDRHFDATGLAFITEPHAKELRSAEVHSGDVLLNITGDGVIFGRCCIVPERILPACVNQHVSIIRPDRRECDPGYLLSVLTHPATKGYIESFNSGGSRRAITKGHIESFEIPLPPLAEQKAIAAALGALDDKIELNRRMNATLEAMARALFQSWFVDFEPVRAKIDGRQPLGMDRTTADQFPATFQNSSLGHIPSGWRTIPLYETAQYVNGAAFKNEDFCAAGEGLPVIKIAELKDGITTQTKWSKRQAGPDQLIDTGDLLYSWSGSPDTSLDAFLWSGGRGLLNQHIFKVIAPTNAQMRFVYYLLQYLRPVLVETARNKQTTGLGHVTVADMKRLLVCWPTKEVFAAFDRIVGSIFDQAFANTLQSRTLATLRDTLLPKLLSGEVSVTSDL